MDLSEVIGVMETNDIGEVNRLLGSGWVLLAVAKPMEDQGVNDGPGFWYSMGQTATSGA